MTLCLSERWKVETSECTTCRGESFSYFIYSTRRKNNPNGPSKPLPTPASQLAIGYVPILPVTIIALAFTMVWWGSLLIQSSFNSTCSILLAVCKVCSLKYPWIKAHTLESWMKNNTPHTFSRPFSHDLHYLTTATTFCSTGHNNTVTTGAPKKNKQYS